MMSWHFHSPGQGHHKCFHCLVYIYGIIDKQMWLFAKWLNQQHSPSQARGWEGTMRERGRGSTYLQYSWESWVSRLLNDSRMLWTSHRQQRRVVTAVWRMDACLRLSGLSVGSWEFKWSEPHQSFQFYLLRAILGTLQLVISPHDVTCEPSISVLYWSVCEGAANKQPPKIQCKERQLCASDSVQVCISEKYKCSRLLTSHSFLHVK